MKNLLKDIKRDFKNRQVLSPDVLLGPFSSIFTNQWTYLQDFNRYISEEPKYPKNQPKCVDLICHSQGSSVCRAYAQIYARNQNPQSQQTGRSQVYVRDFYSLAGPLAGYYCRNKCDITSLTRIATKTVMYSRFSKQFLTSSMLWNDPYNQQEFIDFKGIQCIIDQKCFLENVTVLPLNNTVRRLISISSPSEQVIVPKNSSFFSFYDENGILRNYDFIYQNDSLGLNFMKSEGRYYPISIQGFKHRDYIYKRHKDLYNLCLREFLKFKPVKNENFCSMLK